MKCEGKEARNGVAKEAVNTKEAALQWLCFSPGVVSEDLGPGSLVAVNLCHMQEYFEDRSKSWQASERAEFSGFVAGNGQLENALLVCHRKAASGGLLDHLG